MTVISESSGLSLFSPQKIVYIVKPDLHLNGECKYVDAPNEKNDDNIKLAFAQLIRLHNII
jgi:hypothetical protein